MKQNKQTYFKEETYTAITKIKKLVSLTSSNPHAASSHTWEQSAITPSPRDSVHHAKLLMLTLKSFNGDIITWISFWNLYNSVIHQNPDLSNNDKFNYLKSPLEKPAADTIVGLALAAAANYGDTIFILKKHFDNII